MKKPLFLLITFFIFLSLPAGAESLKSVLDWPAEFDKKTIEIQGEAIGEPLDADHGSWMNLNTGTHQIGVFIPEERAVTEVANWGDYKTTGDIVKVKGTFNQDCPVHQISDLHFISLELVKKGAERNVEVSLLKVQVSIVLGIICLTMIVIYLIKLKFKKD